MPVERATDQSSAYGLLILGPTVVSEALTVFYNKKIRGRQPGRTDIYNAVSSAILIIFCSVAVE